MDVGNNHRDGGHHSLSLGNVSALGGAGKHPEPCFIPKEAQSPRVPLCWSQLLHPCRDEPGSATQIFLDLFSFFLVFISPPPPAKPNKANADLQPKLCHDGFVPQSYHNPWVLHNQVLGKKSFLPLKHTPVPPTPASLFPLSQHSVLWYLSQ